MNPLLEVCLDIKNLQNLSDFLASVPRIMWFLIFESSSFFAITVLTGV